MLDAAWDAGIRHFDVAPSYGYGEAEACLGEFLRQHGGEATVTTKFGIPPASQSAAARLIRNAARPMVKGLPGLKKLLRPAPPEAAAVVMPKVEREPAPRTAKAPNPIFNAKEARASLERSLAALGTGRIDLFLLHEATAEDLRDDRLLRLLEDEVSGGRIGTFGVGSDRSQIEPLLAEHPEYCPALQYEWSIFHPVPPPMPPFRSHHRSLTHNFRAFHGALLADAARCSRWSTAVDQDLANAGVLAKLMLKAALQLNPQSVILFSSKNPGHIAGNVAVAEDDTLAGPALELYRLVQDEL
jgi:aryl-alcohol dehydrogenase-like predicted oxidoreductase